MVVGLQARIDKAVATARAHTNGHRPKVHNLPIVLSQRFGPVFLFPAWTPMGGNG